MRGIWSHSSIRTLLLSMAGLGLLFALMAGLDLATSAEGSAEVRRLLATAVPGTDTLTEARSRLRLLDGELDRLYLAHRSPAATDVLGARQRLGMALARFEGLPRAAGDERLRQELRRAVGELDATLQGFLAAAGRNDRAAERALRLRWDRASRLVDRAFQDGIEFESAHVVRHASRLIGIWRLASLLSVSLGAGALLSTLLAAWFAARAIARQMQFEQDRASELELFSARVAHDLLSPLQATALALARSAAESGEQGQRAAAIGLAALRRVRQIVDDLLAFARAGAAADAAGRSSVKEALASLAEELGPQAEAARAELRCDCPEPIEVACPSGILAVLVTNLVRNSLKFMGGATERVVRVRTAARPRWVRIEVADSGPGFPPGFEPSAFKPYSKGAGEPQPGLGLGMATVKRLVEAHGGSVGLGRSELGGALVWFELPRPRAAPLSSPARGGSPARAR